MARATRKSGSSTAEVVDILNKSADASIDGPITRKRKADVAHRLPGRPSKRGKTPNGPDVAANEVKMEATLESTENSEWATSSTSTRLRKPSRIVYTRKSDPTVKAQGNGDMYDLPSSPDCGSPVTTQQGAGREVRFDLQNPVFDEAPTSGEAGGELSKSPSQRTRSKSARDAKLTLTNPSSRLAGAVHTVRKLPPRAVLSNVNANDSLDLPAGKQPSKDLRSQSQTQPKPGTQGRKAVIGDSERFAYPSPEKTTGVKDRRQKPASRGTASSNKTPPATTKSAKVPHTTSPEESDYEEDQGENEEEAEASEESRDDEEEDAQQEGRGGETENPEEQARTDHEGEDRNPVSDTNNQEPQPPRRKSKFDEAAELLDCWRYWTAAWDAAKKNQDKSDPETKPVRELLQAIRSFKDNLRKSANEISEHEQDLLSDFNETELDKIAMAMGNLRKSASWTGEDEERLLRDIYLHAIPSAVGLLRSLLTVRAAGGKLDMAALEELLMLLKATRRLCERVYHWKPGFHLEDQVKSRFVLDIKRSLKPIEEEYEAELSKLKDKEYMAKAKIWEREFAQRQARSKEAQEREKQERKRDMAQWTRKPEAPAQTRMPSGEQIARNNTSSPDHEVLDADDLDLDDSAPVANGFTREATEDIPGPTKRVWQKEETIALLLLLQKYRGPDRYERIQEIISEIARDIRKLGPDQILTMADHEYIDLDLEDVGDVLDDLGIMEVSDIEQQAKYLKACQTREMEREIRATGNREKWAWLANV